MPVNLPRPPILFFFLLEGQQNDPHGALALNGWSLPQRPLTPQPHPAVRGSGNDAAGDDSVFLSLSAQ